MIILLLLEIVIWILAIWMFLDVIGPLVLGYKPFTIIRKAFGKDKPKDAYNGKAVKSNIDEKKK